MANNKTVMLLGWIMDGQLPLDGESAKNQQIINRMRSLGWRVIALDYYKWKSHPWVVVKTLYNLLQHPHSPIILSSSVKNTYRFMKMHRLLRSSRKVLNWCIGGTMGDKVKNGDYNPAVLKSITCHFVESQQIADDLRDCGVDNAQVVPNFKMVDYIPQKKRHNGPLRFVFMSRIMAEKGVDIIFRAANILNSSGYSGRYIIDFYGNINKPYKQTFETSLASLPDVKYGGILDFSTRAAYDTLASYDVMLFPTLWRGECFAGVFIDAFVAQTPIIASDWRHNRTILQPTGTSIIIDPDSPEALARAMAECIDGSIDLVAMTERCRQIAEVYDSRNIITDDLLKIIEAGQN